ncbi:type I-E CRISPR-associated protein Cas5/CasD [Nocardia sp. SYP-A9097]|uniref:type I-E CRISPR-associated protein Cas5/CasD n=1 Tax=Nocardia sp. SYP-A9097 TaxID=2663237 RepID=UPI00129B98E4|nr:type I-E CRISPR-associated protein Cas5/CasD [Nocardia sp. SYP-A9097]MRH93035.1 type I-E CRISPR-associated protein Cas5/CasD [Nocardia sp. SYP-A9097]
MTVLLLRLAAPLQSWGVASRFARRGTQHFPSKSGVLGLICAARGRRRTDPIEDELLGLAFGVRIDQPGALVRDFQTATSLDGRTRYPLSERFYLSDAIFVAAIEGDRNLLEGVRAELIRPAFPLYLGRRSCPVTEPLVLGEVREGTMPQVLKDAPWQAAQHYRRKQPTMVHLPIFRDATATDTPEALSERVRDLPVSFDPVRREYGWRTIITEHAPTPNPDGHTRTHDPLAAFGGS